MEIQGSMGQQNEKKCMMMAPVNPPEDRGPCGCTPMQDPANPSCTHYACMAARYNCKVYKGDYLSRRGVGVFQSFKDITGQYSGLEK